MNDQRAWGKVETSERQVSASERLIRLEGRFQELPEPNRTCLVGVYAFLTWNNLCDLVKQTPTKTYRSQIPVAFGIPDHVTYQTRPIRFW